MQMPLRRPKKKGDSAQKHGFWPEIRGMECRKRLDVTHLYVLRSDMTGIFKAGRAALEPMTTLHLIRHVHVV